MIVTRENVHITDIQVGDCVEHNGKIMTVCRKDLKSTFMGTTLFGDSYRSGTVPVVRCTPVHVMPKLTPKEEH